ncbi:MAG: DUF4407 domain-containing protein [Tidjanibacter sp.]|nr:DUF4407 domain-containing protein [Tidjanibacter sp.]MBQ3070452.1 DUF4407 domain-containing protein [Tidjanibacter sp.]
MKDRKIKLCCRLIGWNYNILKECTEASRKALYRYVGAVLLLMTIWAFIGFSMATRYFELDTIGAAATACIFAIVILLIERQIILIVGKNRFMSAFRIVLAACMAVIGATVIDQTIFAKDIEAQLSEVIEQRTDAQLQYRKQILDNKIESYRKELDSLELLSAQLVGDINKKPVIRTITYHTTPTGQIDSLGNPIMARGYKQENIPNPKINELERVNKRIESLRNDIGTTTDNIQMLRENLVKENKENIGLLTELEITFSDKVIFSSVASGVFYFVVFIFFLAIELLVVSGKSKSKCDYEALVETRQEAAIKEMCAVMNEANNREQEENVAE